VVGFVEWQWDPALISVYPGPKRLPGNSLWSNDSCDTREMGLKSDQRHVMKGGDAL